MALYLMDFKERYPNNIPDSIDFSNLYRGYFIESYTENSTTKFQLRSNSITDSSIAYSYFSFYVTEKMIQDYESLTFEYKTSTESVNYDYLVVHLTRSEVQPTATNGEGILKAGGTSLSTFTKFTAPAFTEAGTYYMHIQYRKDGSNSNGSDCVWLRNISIPYDSSLPQSQIYTVDFKEQYPTNLPSSIDISQLYRGFYRDTSSGNGDSYSLRSAAISHNGVTSSYIKFEIKGMSSISFDYKTSTEGGSYDYLTVHLTTTETIPNPTSTTNRLLSAGGVTTTYTTFRKTGIPPGVYYLHIQYRKDSSSVAGSDCVWIDNLKIPYAPSFSMYYKNSGVWGKAKEAFIKVNGVWVPVKEAWYKNSGTWVKTK